MPAHAISLMTTGRRDTSGEMVFCSLSLPDVSIAFALNIYDAVVVAMYVVEVAVVLAKEKLVQVIPVTLHSRM